MRPTDLGTLVRAGVVAGWLLGLPACGGGGGGSPNPVFGALSFTTNENVALSAAVQATDPASSTVTFTKTSDPKSGALTVAANGQFTYTPTADFHGNDSFGIQAVDAAGNKTAATVSITVTMDRAPVANNTIVRADAGGLSAIKVLQTASDPDKDTLTVAILEQPPSGLGTASVNNDGTVAVSGLSSDFKGLTTFKYQVTDPSGMTAQARAAVFVGTDPFRASFVGDSAANGSNEVYLTDFAADPVVMTAATQGNARLKGYAISDNGATIVYRADDPSAGTTLLSFVKTAVPAHATAIALPSGTVPVLDSNNRDQFIVSPDGQWIAMIAGQGNLSSLYVVNVSNPTVVSPIQPAGASVATLPTFSLDSKNIYFLATTSTDGRHRSLYFATLSSPATTVLISQFSDPAKSDEIYAYSVSPDQTRVLLDANRLGGESIVFVDTSHPGTEAMVSRPTAVGQSIRNSTVGLPAGRGGSTTVSRVAYSVTAGLNAITDPAGIYVAEVSTSPNPRLMVTNQTVIGLRPDDKAVLYTDGAQISEAVVDVSGTQPIGGGFNGWYDSTGNIVLLQQQVPYKVLASTARGAFGTTNRVGTTSLANIYTDVSGFDRGVAIIAQGPTSGSPPAAATLQLVSAQAPQGLVVLAPFQSPLQLSSPLSKVVAAAP